MEKSSTSTLLWVAALVCAGIGYGVYENHISSGFKGVVLASFDAKNATPDADQALLQKAQSAAHTRKDKKVLSQFQHLIEIRKDVAIYDHKIWDRLDAELTDLEPAIPTPYHHLLAQRDEYVRKHMAVPADLQAQVDKATEEQQQARSQRHEQERVDKERADRERQEITDLTATIRAEM